MDNNIKMTKGQSEREKALQNVLKQYEKICRRTSKKEWKELEDEMYETTRVTLDNLTSDDL